MIYVNSITICPENVTIKKGKWYYDTYAEIHPTNATCNCLTWHSSNPNIASVNENGCICGVSEGVAVIYATAQDGSGAVGFCTVTVVSPIKVSSVTVTPSTKSINVGDTFGLSATVCPQNAEDKRIRWTSCDCNIADVDYLTGCVTAKSAGTTCICANAVDGSGVQGRCEVTCNTIGTDSIGVFRTLSMLSATPNNTETGAPVMLGIQFKERQDGNYDMRLVSQIKSLYYRSVGFEIHSKFGCDIPAADIICLEKAYSSFIADGETLEAGEGNYFVLGVLENIPRNTVVSFKITPFAMTLEGEFLHGSTTLFHCKDAQKIESDDGVNIETPEHLNTSTHIRVNTGNGTPLNLMSLPGENGTVLGKFANEKEIALIIDTPQNEKWYAVYGQTIDGTYEFGWCSGEYLEKETTFLKFIAETKTSYVRNNFSLDDNNVVGEISCGMQVELVQERAEYNNGYYWNKVIYNDEIAYIADLSGRFETVVRWAPLRYTMSAIVENRYLTDDEKRHNARIIYKYLTYKGWSKNAICGAIANMEAESSLSPGRWEMEDSDNDGDKAYGVLQWDPPTKWINYANSHDYEQNNIYRQLDYLIYSMRYGGGEWLVGGVPNAYQLYAYEYTCSSRSVYDLAIVFLLCYERPTNAGSSVMNYRGGLAETWEAYFDSLGW